MKNTKSKKVLGALAIIGAVALASVAQAGGHWPPTANPPPGTPTNPGPTIIVTGQGDHGTAYSTIVLGSLPMEGPFQELIPINASTLMTEFGPGDPEYAGGRWWIDNPNEGTQGVMDGYDTYFECPLIGPGTPLTI